MPRLNTPAALLSRAVEPRWRACSCSDPQRSWEKSILTACGSLHFVMMRAAGKGRRESCGSTGSLTCGSTVTRRRTPRSEEHTSELQSLMRISYAVFCLKKKNEDVYNE